MLCYLGAVASILTLERCRPSVSWVKTIELSTTPTHHPHLAIFVCFYVFVFCQFGLEGWRGQSSDFSGVLEKDFFLHPLLNLM